MNMVTLVMHSSIAFTLLADGRAEFPPLMTPPLRAELEDRAIRGPLDLPTERAVLTPTAPIVVAAQFPGAAALPRQQALVLRFPTGKALLAVDRTLIVALLVPVGWQVFRALLPMSPHLRA